MYSLFIEKQVLRCK